MKSRLPIRNGRVEVARHLGGVRDQDRNRMWKWVSHATTVVGLFAALVLVVNLSARMNAAYSVYTDHPIGPEQPTLVENGPYGPMVAPLLSPDVPPINGP